MTFGYETNKPVLKDITLHVKPGEMLGVVGRSGAGKTTLVNLLMRFYETDSGAILVSGVPTRTVRRSSLRNAFGMVLQETWLKSGTIRENIAFGKQDADECEIIVFVLNAEGICQSVQYAGVGEAKSY